MLTAVRSINLFLGGWLVVSAFMWTHSRAQLVNVCVVGITSAVMAALAMGTPRLRWVNGVLALWLFVSALTLPHSEVATIWNSIAVALVMFSVSAAETMGPIRATGDGREPTGP